MLISKRPFSDFVISFTIPVFHAEIYKIWFKTVLLIGNYLKSTKSSFHSVSHIANIVTLQASGFNLNYKSSVLVFRFLSAPEEIPATLSSFTNKSTSCELLWQPVNDSRSDTDGRVLGYRVHYKRIGSSVKETVEIPGPNSSQTTVQGLEEFSTYEMSVVAYNLFGEGNASLVVNCTTVEDGEPNAF